MRRLSMKSKKGKADASDSESTHQDDVEDEENIAESDAESASSEGAKVDSKRKNKRGRKKGNDVGADEGHTETKKKKRNVNVDETAEAVEYESEAESASNEDAKADSKQRNKHGRKKGNNAGTEDSASETKKKKQNVTFGVQSEDVQYESEAESASNEDAKADSKQKSKHGRKKGNNAGTEDSATEAKKKKQNVTFGEQSENVQYEVESIVDMKQSHGKRQFKIHWKGYGPDNDTWEYEEDLNCPNIIKTFLEKNKSERTNESKAKKRAGKGGNNRIPKKSKTGGEKVDVTSDGEEESKEYEVDKVMEVHFKKNGSREFLIHWKGFSHKEDTWEPEKNLNCPHLIDKFMEKVNKAKSTDTRELRANPQHTDRFTLNMTQAGRRLSRRNQGKQRASYHGYM